jgi:alkylation response protein AidB-like acyl-CoA dehydrogenase
MPNFLTDNDDILFHLDHLPLAEIAALQEEGFRDAGTFDYAPADAADAVDGYRKILDLVGDIAGNRIAPLSESIDRQGSTFENGKVTYADGIRKSLDLLSKADLMGFTLPRRYGGLNCPSTVYAMATEIVSRADAGLMNIFGLQGIAETINAFANEDQKQRFLPRFSSGEVTGAMVLTEPDAGSDLQNVQLRAYQDAKGVWRLKGVKRFITNGCGEVLLVLARSEPDEVGGMGLSLFLMERDETVQIRRIEDKLGIHGSPTCEMQFNDSPCELVGERRRGLVTYVMALMNGARIGIAAQGLGIAEAAYREARAYAHHREQFGRPIEKLPPVADLLVDMKVNIEAGRALLYHTCVAVDHDINLQRRIDENRYTDEAARAADNRAQKQLKRLTALLTPMSKYYCSELAQQCANDGISVLGGSGYMRDYRSEQLFRDARITTIYEGTSQLQVVAAIRGVTSGQAEKHFVELASREPADDAEQHLRDVLGQMRGLLQTAVDKVKAGGADYLDLSARNLVDTAIDILIGYLLLEQAAVNDRKKLVAKRFILRALPRAKARIERVMSDERSTLDHYDAIIGPLVEDEA